MNIEQALLDQVRSLTPEQQQEVLNFAASLPQKASVTLKKERVPGLHKADGYWMADDFDAPLPDEFWLGEA